MIESEIRNNNKCDFDRYYGSASAYHSIADAIQKRMDVLAKVSFAGIYLVKMSETPDAYISLSIRWCGLVEAVDTTCCPNE